MKPIFTEAESKAIEHISRQCGHTWKAAMAYRAMMQAIKIRKQPEGWTEPKKTK